MITVRAGPGCIEVTGHANYAPPGFDIVCAAVSTLVDTLVASVEDLPDDGIKEDLQPGGLLSDMGIYQHAVVCW